MPRAQGCAGVACVSIARHKQKTVCRSFARYAAGAGMRTTAGMQEVGPRRSSCRGVACVSFARHINVRAKPLSFAQNIEFLILQGQC